MNTDRKWLRKMAEKEDGCEVAVGGLGREVFGPEPTMDPITALRNLRLWLQHGLDNLVVHVRVEPDSPGAHHPRGWAAVRFPDWDVRQHLAEIDATLTAAQSRKSSELDT